MNESQPSHLADSDLPISAENLHLYGRFWDVLSVLIFGFAAVAVLASHAGDLTWREWAVAGLSVAQGALYLFCIRGGGWPISQKNLTIYFVGGVCMWVLACWLNPFAWWLGFTYFGQMFGLLPLRGVVFGTAVVTFFILLIISDWNITQIPFGAAFGFSFMWIGGMAVFLFIYGIIRTSSQRADLITKLESAQKELEAARQRDAELATLRERERLARDLHDSLGHSLVALSVQLEAIQRLYKVDADKASAQVDELKDLTRASMDELRRSLAGLRAPGLGERKLSEALQTLSVDVAQRAHLAVTCHIHDDANQLSPVHAETLWRVAQEALTNIERHAAARNVDLNLDIESQHVTLTITDDGCGFPADAENKPGHYGLRGMRERVEGLGGALTLSGNSGGSRVDVRLPLL
ncbi:MAG: sensor histidine kinase [Anaerolineae bacterium]|nr:sensor histidine kinase [Anaerolineae bacterium]MBL8105895.1 sensor histidine kinase [Anaerolineales bacterium]MCC7188546.1 sensor histidine kinase [Anaerolineales bacterium]